MGFTEVNFLELHGGVLREAKMTLVFPSGDVFISSALQSRPTKLLVLALNQ